MAQLVSKIRCFKGYQFVYKHQSSAVQCEMTFGVYVPDHADDEKLAGLFYLSGLTCTHQNFMEKAGFQQHASLHRLVVVHPDTSPRGVDISGDSDNWDFGKGAGFYVDATEEKWAKHYRMYSYVVDELPKVVAAVAPIDLGKLGIFGHSMGGHGALTIGLRNPQLFHTISALAPISHPINCDWGQKAFSGYLGADQKAWEKYDASLLFQSYNGPKRTILVDQGTADNFLDRLQPDSLHSTPSLDLQLRMREGYDHSFYFISTFIAEHVQFHADQLNKL